MKAHLAIPIVSVLIHALTALPGYGQQQNSSKTLADPGQPPAVEIENLEIVGQANVGSSFEVRVRYTPHIDARGETFMRSPEAISLTGAPSGQRQQRQSHTFQKGLTETKTFTLQVKKTVSSILQVGITVPNASDGYNKTARHELYIESTKNSFETYDPRTPDKEGQQTPFGVREQPLQETTRGALPEQMQNRAPQSYTVSVNGKAQYTSGVDFKKRGVYGAKVKFWFYDKDNNSFYHPVSGSQKNIHYDIIDEERNYSFDFNFTGDVSKFEYIVLYVRFKNKATVMKSEPKSQLFSHSYDANETSITFSKDINVWGPEGATLRQMMLAREFVYERYNGNPPFEFGRIATYLESLTKGSGVFRLTENAFSWDREIGIDPEQEGDRPATTVHEYGHWMHERMWDSPEDRAEAGDPFTEGWAIFFSFAGRNYTNQQYGDPLQSNRDNTETAPFKMGTDENDEPYRFESIGYAYGGEPKPAAFGCFLWNLYDGYNGGDFESPEFSSGDNDDVSGYKQLVFDAARSMEYEGNLTSKYMNEFKDGVPANLESSVQSIHDFMFSDLNNIPGTPMRPPQLTGASGQIKSNGDIEFQWSERTYPTGRDYGNYPDGYRIRRGGETVETVPFGTTSHTYSPDETKTANYQLTAYNEDGEAGSARILDLLDIEYISGPAELDEGEQGTWSASVSKSGVSFDWYKEGDDGWAHLASGSPMTWSKDYISSTITVDLKVEVKKGKEKATGLASVLINNNNGDPGCDGATINRICQSAETESLNLRDVQAKSINDRVRLNWRAAGPVPSIRFVVQHRADSTDGWSTIGTVPASDSSSVDSSRAETYRFRTDPLETGMHQFRVGLPQNMDSEFRVASPDSPDASQRFTGAVTSTIEMENDYRFATYPNPVRDQATVELMVKERQDVQVSLYDVIGRRVAMLHSGPLPAQELRSLHLNASAAGLTSGTYFVRAKGEDFSATKQVTVVR